MVRNTSRQFCYNFFIFTSSNEVTTKMSLREEKGNSDNLGSRDRSKNNVTNKLFKEHDLDQKMVEKPRDEIQISGKV